MRVVFAVAAGLMWATAAYAQTTPPEASSAEPTASQAQSPTTNTAPASDANNAVTVQSNTDREHEVVCRTTMATGSRLAGRGHGQRTCKTRQQWEMEEADLQRRVGMANRGAFYSDPRQQGSN